jgi:hypothetical protein
MIHGVSGASLRVALTWQERPDLVKPAGDATGDAFHVYNYHVDVIEHYWPRVMAERLEFQFNLLEGDEIVARACTIPTRWDGTLDDLPQGIDQAVERSFEDGGRANVLCAMLIAIPRAHRGRHVSFDALRAMIELARRHGLASLIAPVRPTLKERYPLTPIERYVQWRREDGLPFDPWIRIHERFGGRILRPAPRSARITGSIADWEEWTGMAFPDSGEYVFPGCLATVDIDREADVGRYWEPNVWMLHEIGP